MRFTCALLALGTAVLFFSCSDNPTSNSTVQTSTQSSTQAAAPPSTGAPPTGAAAAAPVPKFTITPRKGDIDTMYRFDASLSQGNIQSFAWNFGDGATGTGKQVQHRYAEKGRYTIELSVNDGTTTVMGDKRIRVRKELSDGGGGGGGGEGGSKCAYTNPRRKVWFFTVLSHNPAAKTIIAKFQQPAGCQDVFYLCGDVRIGGIKPGEREYWIGTICEMWNLGNNTFRIHLVDGRFWVENGESGTYVWPQYDCNPHVECTEYGY